MALEKSLVPNLVQRKVPVTSYFDGSATLGALETVGEKAHLGENTGLMSASSGLTGNPIHDISYDRRRIMPLDYESDTPGLPVYYMDTASAPHDLQKKSRPNAPAADVPKPGPTTSMPYSHMGVYRGEDMLGGYDEGGPSPSSTDTSLDDDGSRPGLLMHAPTAPPPYPKPADMYSWIASQDILKSLPPEGPLSAPGPLVGVPGADYPTSMVSVDRPFGWIEDVTADQAIEADGFKRCEGCAISYRITDGKRCRCTPSAGDGERPGMEDYFAQK
ncbi:hypothetical protein OE88DRAFT_1084975 [Heliocybe sulcata]|uniref:Uncharacterized protein n=1 Tax=Heliocybe sulcata TaxID=5364 RepID=A0A5C3MMC7_9AGAM|nr:hypothetical protein OE88DRAFT_1084975 [Heliocybe sulcata]